MRTSGLIRTTMQESKDQLPNLRGVRINCNHLLTGQGEMFELQSYCSASTTLLKKHLAVATFDRKGRQYWKGSLADDLRRLIDMGKLNGREMCPVVRTLYEYLDVEQFGELLERMGR